MKKITLVVVLLSILLLYGCGLKSFPDMSLSNPVQVYSESVFKDGKVDNESIKTILSNTNTAYELVKKLYNENVSIEPVYYNKIFIRIPKIANTDFFKILEDYCAVRTNNRYYTKLVDYKGDDEYYKSKTIYITKGWDRIPLINSTREKFFCTFDTIKNEKHKVILDSGKKANNLLFTIERSDEKYENYISFILNSYPSEMDEHYLLDKYKRKLDEQIKAKNAIDTLEGKSPKMDVIIDFSDNNKINYIEITLKSDKKGGSRPLSDFISPLYVNGKAYNYNYNYYHNSSYCPYNRQYNTFLLMPAQTNYKSSDGRTINTSEVMCNFRIDIREHDNLPKNLAALSDFKWKSPYATVKLTKKKAWNGKIIELFQK